MATGFCDDVLQCDKYACKALYFQKTLWYNECEALCYGVRDPINTDKERQLLYNNLPMQSARQNGDQNVKKEVKQGRKYPKV